MNFLRNALLFIPFAFLSVGCATRGDLAAGARGSDATGCAGRTRPSRQEAVSSPRKAENEP